MVLWLTHHKLYVIELVKGMPIEKLGLDESKLKDGLEFGWKIKSKVVKFSQFSLPYLYLMEYYIIYGALRGEGS